MKTHDTIRPAEACCHQLLVNTEDYARDNPAQAAAWAFGAGLLLNLLPTQAIARPITTLAVKLLPPALMGLGMIKIFEFCCGKRLASVGKGGGAPLRHAADSL